MDQDRPQYQSPRYANRTSLFHQDLQKGNASLRLDRTTLEDAGENTCSISTQLGSQKKSFRLKVAAEFEISVPTGVQMGVYGESVVLPCTFPVGSSWDAGSSVITWQRQLEVVHSCRRGMHRTGWTVPL
ncbi:hypothetical protein HF521_009632 [Silurus meridionalis]|uniref:Uncharacterized protein n=1 Tax=Silurus meridionalis TaxID=175797 RepID=A0A8T0BYW0_SILME|nr:hypothetical protein HF521_009632 [Silurus meridionalis]